MPYIDKEKFRMHIIMYQYNPLKVKLTDKEKEKFTRMLDEVPTADVVEVKRGKWTYHTDALPMSPYGHYECSECGQLIAHQENYCPKCGAKMQKGGAE